MALRTISRDRRSAILGGGGGVQSRWTGVLCTTDSRRWNETFLSLLYGNRCRAVECELGLGYGYGCGSGDLWCRNHALAIGWVVRFFCLRLAAFRLLDLHWASSWAASDGAGDQWASLEQTGDQRHQNCCAFSSHSLPYVNSCCDCFVPKGPRCHSLNEVLQSARWVFVQSDGGRLIYDRDVAFFKLV